MTARQSQNRSRLPFAAASAIVWAAFAVQAPAQLVPRPTEAVPTAPFADEPETQTPPQRFNFAPNIPERDLLPIAPQKAAPYSGLAKDLAQVPEIHFQDAVARPKLPKADTDRLDVSIERSSGATTEDIKRAWQKYGDTLSAEEVLAKAEEAARERAMTQQQIVRQMQAISYLNQKKTDRFVELLSQNRPDLAGLPFVMGDACRLKKEEGGKFAAAVSIVQNSLRDNEDARAFWKSFKAAVQQQPRKTEKDMDNGVDAKAYVAALMQILPKQSAEVRLGLVKQLTAYNTSQPDRDEATKALARLSIYSPEEQIRRAASKTLLKRATGPATDVLARGLRYPWAAIAANTAEALVEQQRTDLIPQLVSMLEEADPRAPVLQEVDGKKVLVVRELVRINHMRNCLLCHPPAGNVGNREVSRRSSVSNDVVTGPVPAPGHDLQNDPDNGGYGSSQNPEILIRADTTYLRQDFSLMQKVENAEPWPEMQRFDFLVRTRVVSKQEADALRAELGRQPSPYRLAALSALRRLTGRDAGDTAQAWRSALAN